MTMRRRYQQARDGDSDIANFLPRLYAAVLHLDAQRVVELGVREGVSTLAFLAALERTGGHLWSVDIVDDHQVGDHPQWTFIHGNDLSTDVWAQTPVEVDLLFIDTSHDYDHTLLELNAYGGKVRAGGLIFCHDTQLEFPSEVTPQPPFPVARALDEYCAAHHLEWVNDPAGWGMGSIEV